MTDKEKEEFYEAMDLYEDSRRKRAIKALFERDSISLDIQDFNYAMRCFLWLKTLICLLLKRTKGSYLDKHTLCILAYDERSGYESQSWEAVWTCYDIFSGWQVCVGSDGT